MSSTASANGSPVHKPDRQRVAQDACKLMVRHCMAGVKAKVKHLDYDCVGSNKYEIKQRALEPC